MEQSDKIDKFLSLLDKSGVCDLLNNLLKKKKKNDTDKGGRPSHNPYNVLALILFNFSFGKGTLREIEDSCKYNLRCIYIMQDERHSHMTLGNFINDYILPNAGQFFSLITKAIFDECNLKMDKLYIDGSKFEANANKYKFVWKQIKFHIRLCDKVRNLLSEYNLTRGLSVTGLISSQEIVNKLFELNAILKKLNLTNKSNRKHVKNYELLIEYLKKSLEYEEKERICGPNRNSYYKTDNDATAMCLKEDYYSGLGSNMHAGYNTQIGVINGLISTYLVTQSRHDSNDFTLLLDTHYKFYHSYPKSLCADAGYGSYENYKYLEKHNIRNFVKYFSWQGNVSGRNPSQYRFDINNETIICLNGNIG